MFVQIHVLCRTRVSDSRKSRIVEIIVLIATIYLFFLSIKLLGHSFKLFGKGFAEMLLNTTADPFAGLLIGVVATSLIQSSSTTTSLIVGLVAAGVLNLDGAIPMIMGANIGTTITNTLVSLAHVSRRIEFRRAFSAGIVHDLFNVCAVIVLFPIELLFHPIRQIALALHGLFDGVGGMKLLNPLNFILNPVTDLVDHLTEGIPFRAVVMVAVSIVLLFVSLAFLVRTIRVLVVAQIEIVINRYVFRNDFVGLTLGMLLTFIVQSSSVTTSIIVPLAGAGVVTLRQVFPYTLGVNVGTTGTAMLAALATQNPIAVTVAFAHLSFNILGIMVFYPLRAIPIGLAEYIAGKASISKRNLIICVAMYLLLYSVPLVFILL